VQAILAALPSIGILLILGVYLSLEWSRTMTGTLTFKNALIFFFVDGAHVALIAAAAIAVSPGNSLSSTIELLPWILTGFYGITAAGHYGDIWAFQSSRTCDDSFEKRWYRIVAIGNHILALAACVGIALIEADIAKWIFLVLTCSLVVSLVRSHWWQPDRTEARIKLRKDNKK
jgi:hypothetical protein